jgi:hypothetical protein
VPLLESWLLLLPPFRTEFSAFLARNRTKAIIWNPFLSVMYEKNMIFAALYSTNPAAKKYSIAQWHELYQVEANEPNRRKATSIKTIKTLSLTCKPRPHTTQLFLLSRARHPRITTSATDAAWWVDRWRGWSFRDKRNDLRQGRDLIGPPRAVYEPSRDVDGGKYGDQESEGEEHE